MLNVEDWAEIRRLHRAEGVPIKETSRRLGVARNTVRAPLHSERPPKRSLSSDVSSQVAGLSAIHSPRQAGVDSAVSLRVALLFIVRWIMASERCGHLS